MLLYCLTASTGRAQATPLVSRQNLISKSHSRAPPKRFNIGLTCPSDSYYGQQCVDIEQLRRGEKRVNLMERRLQIAWLLLSNDKAHQELYSRVVDLAITILRVY